MAESFPECLRIMPEYGSSGIWVVKSHGPFRHGMIEHRDLDLPEEMARGFREWITQYWKILDAPAEFNSELFNKEGRRLAQALKAYVGSATKVLFVPIGPDNCLQEEEQLE